MDTFNTNTLGYKLLSGKLREKRKHSEQLNKMLAGLIDTDGCISMFFYKTRTTGKQRGKIVLTLSMTEIPLVEALAAYYRLGSLSYPTVRSNEQPIATWTLREKDTLILLGRILKHLRLKATHADNLMWLTRQLRDIEDIPNVEELKEFVKCSREQTTYLKMPKHLSWSYVAGVIAGDGCIRVYQREGRKSPVCSVKVTQGDTKLLTLLRRDFKGGIYKNREWYDWERNLGIRDASFAVPFLKKIRQYMCHEGKYKRIEEILKFHEEHKQQRLSKGKSKD